MALPIIVKLTTAGADTGPFDLYTCTSSDCTSCSGSAFATNVPKSAITGSGYSTTVPDGTAAVKVVSTGTCTNNVCITIPPTPTPTPTLLRK